MQLACLAHDIDSKDALSFRDHCVSLAIVRHWVKVAQSHAQQKMRRGSVNYKNRDVIKRYTEQCSVSPEYYLSFPKYVWFCNGKP